MEDNGGGAALQRQKIKKFLAAGPGAWFCRLLITAAQQLQKLPIIGGYFPAVAGGWIGREGDAELFQQSNGLAGVVFRGR